MKWVGLVEGYSQYQRTVITAIHLAPDYTVTEVRGHLIGDNKVVKSPARGNTPNLKPGASLIPRVCLG